MKNIKKIFCVPIASFVIFIIYTKQVVASSILELLNLSATNAKYHTGESSPTIWQTVGKFIGVFLSFLGVIFICLAIYAGYMWMTAAGDEEKVTKAKDTLKDAIIGLIITIGAYALTYFILYYLASGGVEETGL